MTIAPPPAVTPPGEAAAAAVPWEGVLEALSSYSGKGQLYAAVAAISGEDQWSEADTRRRARRVLFEEALPLLASWPRRAAEWKEALPPRVTTQRQLTPAPQGRVDWPRTRSQGWPPAAGFWSRTRERRDDQDLVRTLTWTLRRLLAVRADAVALVPDIDRDVAAEIELAATVLRGLPSVPTDGRPDRTAVAAAAGAGRPWRAMADVTRVLATEDDDVADVARRLLLPDPAARGRLFHLGCLGLILSSLRKANARVRSLRPLGVGSGPAYWVRDANGRTWDLWVEGSGMWTHYGKRSPYAAATRHLPGAAQNLGADLVLTLPGRYALVIECKYSNNVGYVCRNGYEQVLTYQAEVLTGLVPSASAAVVGPDGVLRGVGSTRTTLGLVSVLPAADLSSLVIDAMSSVAGPDGAPGPG